MDDASTVEFILLEGVDPDSVYETETVNRGKFGDALLHWACRYDAKESAKVNEFSSTHPLGFAIGAL